jgi:eukaryotic-like serine/threonine-protein kinase
LVSFGVPDDDDATAEGYGPVLDGDVIDATTPVARAAKRRLSPSSQVPALAPAPVEKTETSSEPPREPTVQLTSPTAPGVQELAVLGPRTAPPAETVHSHPTQQIAVRSVTDAADASRLSTAISPMDALRDDEINRMRGFLKLVALACAATVLAIAYTPGDPVAKVAVYAGTAVVGAAALLLVALIRADGSGYTPRLLTIGAVVMATGAAGGIYFWGVASPASALYVYGIYVFSLGGELAVIVLLYMLVAAIHLVLAVLIITGATVDRGIVPIAGYELRQQVGLIFVPQALYFLAFITARANRRSTFDTVTKLEKAVRSVSQREAMLAEVRAELDRALKVGGPGRYTDQIVGSYRLATLIGRGGMGEVYEGVSVHDGREAAVKLLHPSTLADPQQVQRFVRETEVAARISCPNVVSVLEVGTTTGEIPFLAMERLRGFDLAHQLRRHRTLPIAQVVEMVSQIANGLEAARNAGIVHRDLKPHNLFLAERNNAFTWKVLDFGVSKLTSHHGTLTQGHVVGTPGYMAPEQARGDDVDHRADVYSLTAIIYRSLTGHPPFTGKDVPSTLYDVVYKQPTQPSALQQLPSDIDRVIAIGMAKNAGDRFVTADALAAAFTMAARSDLPQELRRRADDLIEKFPWGTRI